MIVTVAGADSVYLIVVPFLAAFFFLTAFFFFGADT